MTKHSDLNSIEDCHTRAEDIGHNTYGIVDYNVTSKSGTCYTGKYDNISHRGSSKSVTVNVAQTDDSCTLTLLKNGNLIMWNGSDYKTSSNELYDDNIKWSSTTNGGSTDSSCHAIFGGGINSISATYGSNCSINS